MKKQSKVQRIIYRTLIILGFCLISYPFVSQMYYNYVTKQENQSFINTAKKQSMTEINEKIKEDDDYQKAQLKINHSDIKATTNEEIRKTNIYALNKNHLEIYTNRFIEV